MRRIGILSIICIGLAAPGWAQPTREEQRAEAQAAKAKDLQLYVPTAVEKYSARIGQSFLNPPPIYAYIGGIYPGGAAALGPGVRHRFVSGALADVHGAWSIKNFKMVDGSFKLPAVLDRRLLLEAHANWTDAPKVAFFGFGPDTVRGDRVNFAYRSTTAGGSARVKLLPVVSVGGGLDYLDLDTERDRPSIDSFVPGLTVSPTYARSHLFAAVDWRDGPGYTRRGGLYRIDWSSYQQRNSGPYSFTRVDAELDQFLPVRTNWVFAFRALTSITDTNDGDEIPVALLPTLGGGSELRGYSNWRFRDRSRLLLSGEYRWLAGNFVDMALFLDAGTVASRGGDLEVNDLNTSYGGGIRFHTPAATVIRLDVAKTGDGFGVVMAFGPSF